MNKKEKMMQKSIEAFYEVMKKHKEFVPHSKIYGEFFDEMRSRGIKANIPTRQQFAMFTSSLEDIEKEYRVYNRRREIHFRKV